MYLLAHGREKSAADVHRLIVAGTLSRIVRHWAAIAELGNRRYRMYRPAVDFSRGFD